MKSYLQNSTARRKIQIGMCIVQAVLAVPAIIFMTLFVTTPAPSERDFSLCAIVFGCIWGAAYLVQLAFAYATRNKIAEKQNHDVVFWRLSIFFVVIVAAIYGIIAVF